MALAKNTHASGEPLHSIRATPCQFRKKVSICGGKKAAFLPMGQRLGVDPHCKSNASPIHQRPTVGKLIPKRWNAVAKFIDSCASRNRFDMLSIEALILITGILLLLGIVSNKFSARMGVPVLVLFLLVGMLAGSEGIGGIEFENYSLANGIGTIALSLILFDGGLRTPYRSIRAAWKPAGVLATIGVFITALITGLAASWFLQIPLMEGLLLGSIVGSTDASVVFSVLRFGGVHIRRRLADTLEVESGSNDPMAIFLTVGLIQVLTGAVPLGPGLVVLFLTQIVFGTVVGLLVGWGGVWVLKNIQLSAAGLYPVLATGLALFSFGFAAAFGGSGFLAVYLTGIVIGNRRPVFHRGILLFHDAIAWLCQILMFIALGILPQPVVGRRRTRTDDFRRADFGRPAGRRVLVRVAV